MRVSRLGVSAIDWWCGVDQENFAIRPNKRKDTSLVDLDSASLSVSTMSTSASLGCCCCRLGKQRSIAEVSGEASALVELLLILSSSLGLREGTSDSRREELPEVFLLPRRSSEARLTAETTSWLWASMAAVSESLSVFVESIDAFPLAIKTWMQLRFKSLALSFSQPNPRCLVSWIKAGLRGGK